MQVAGLFKTASREANILAAASLGLLFFKIFVLNRFQAFFWWGYEIGIITESVLASVVASYAFYLLVIHVKERSDGEILRPYIEKHSRRIIGDCRCQLHDIGKAAGVTLSLHTLTAAEIEAAFQKIDPMSAAPLLLSFEPTRHANWLQFFGYHIDRTRFTIRKLFDQLPYMDVRLVCILSEIDDCPHFMVKESLAMMPVRNTDLSAWSPTFFKYCELCRKLNLLLPVLGLSGVAETDF